MKEKATLIFACVRSGPLYSFDYVVKLRNMIARHCRLPYIMICFSDQSERCADVQFIDTSQSGLSGWWQKLLIFEPTWRGQSKVCYVDLDTVIISDLAPLAAVPGEFAVTESFTRLAGNVSYPCRYNSSVMVVGPNMAGHIWSAFDRDRQRLMKKHEKHGDQAAIEEICPDAALLQVHVPKGYFLNYRHLTMHKPPKAAVVTFGGVSKPHNCPVPWVEEAWR